MPSRAVAYLHKARAAETRAKRLAQEDNMDAAQVEATLGLTALQKAANYWEGSVPVKHVRDMMETQLVLYQIYAEARTRTALELRLTRG